MRGHRLSRCSGVHLQPLRAAAGIRTALSIHRAPVAAIAGHQPAGDEQDQIHEPPDPQPAQGQQLPHGGPGVAEAEPIHSEAPQEEGVEQSGDEVVSSVPAMGARFLPQGSLPRGAGSGAAGGGTRGNRR